jgi:hypothetical protein
MLREYDTWRNCGLIHKHVVSMVGAPSQNLKAQIGTQINRGQDAQKAYQTGTMDPLDLGPTQAPAPK